MQTSRGTRGYAICTTPRSGSNLLCALLASTGVLGEPHEVGKRLDDPDYPKDQASQVERILTRDATANGIYGLKLFPDQQGWVGHPLKWTEALPQLRFILLERHDLLGQAISWARARQTRQFSSRVAAKAEPVYDGDAIRKRLEELVELRARWELFFARNDLGSARIIYEEMVDEPQRAVDRVADLVGLDRQATVDLRCVSLSVQRDATTVDWRRRFVAEFGDVDTIDQPYEERQKKRRLERRVRRAAKTAV